MIGSRADSEQYYREHKLKTLNDTIDELKITISEICRCAWAHFNILVSTSETDSNYLLSPTCKTAIKELHQSVLDISTLEKELALTTERLNNIKELYSV